MTDTFSTPAEHAFEHGEISEAIAGPSTMGDATEEMGVEEAFEVEDTIHRIREGGYKTIGLQFPDELLPHSVKVFRAIQKGIADTGAQAYVLADSTYGSCCPDVLSCLHLPADYLVHYGHACLTPTDALPVHYVFPRQKLDLEEAKAALLEASTELNEGTSKGIMVVWDVAFDWLSDEILLTLGANVPYPISFATIRRPSAFAPGPGPGSAATERTAGKAPALRSLSPPDGLEERECVIWYLGEEGRSSLNIQMTHAANPIYAYSPSSSVTPLHTRTSRLLQKRLFALHSAMASDVFGLVVGNVGLASSQQLLNQLRQQLKKASKKSYTLSVGRLNPAKLANFAEIECFVLVGCAEGGVVDSKDFLRPIITPWEMLLALKGPENDWEPDRWTLDLSKVLDEAREQGESSDTRDPADPEFSLISGTLRSKKTYGAAPDTETETVEGIKDLTLRNQDFSLSKLESAGSVYLNSRHFKGLEQRYGMDEPATLEQGRSGIARGYGEEKE